MDGIALGSLSFATCTNLSEVVEKKYMRRFASNIGINIFLKVKLSRVMLAIEIVV